MALHMSDFQSVCVVLLSSIDWWWLAFVALLARTASAPSIVFPMRMQLATSSSSLNRRPIDLLIVPLPKPFQLVKEIITGTNLQGNPNVGGRKERGRGRWILFTRRVSLSAAAAVSQISGELSRQNPRWRPGGCWGHTAQMPNLLTPATWVHRLVTIEKGRGLKQCWAAPPPL